MLLEDAGFAFSEAEEEGAEFFGVDGFDEEGVEAEVLGDAGDFGDVAGEGDDFDVLAPEFGTDFFADCVAVHGRHVDVEQDHFGAVEAGHGESFGAGVRGVAFVAADAQERAEHFGGVFEIVDDKEAPARGKGMPSRGSVVVCECPTTAVPSRRTGLYF